MECPLSAHSGLLHQRLHVTTFPAHTVTPSLAPLWASHRWSTGKLIGSFCEPGLLRPADNTIKVGSVRVGVARVCERGKMTGTSSLTGRRTKTKGRGHA